MIVVAIMVVIMIIPITIGVPAVSIFIPPTMLVFPAVRARFGKFMAPMFGFRTLPTVVLDGFVKLVVRLGGALLTVVRAHHRGAREENYNCKH